MTIKFSSSFQVCDEDSGKVHRQGNVSLHADGDTVSMEYIKNMVDSLNCAIGAVIEDTEF